MYQYVAQLQEWNWNLLHVKSFVSQNEENMTYSIITFNPSFDATKYQIYDEISEICELFKKSRKLLLLY